MLSVFPKHAVLCFIHIHMVIHMHMNITQKYLVLELPFGLVISHFVFWCSNQYHRSFEKRTVAKALHLPLTKQTRTHTHPLAHVRARQKIKTTKSTLETAALALGIESEREEMESGELGNWGTVG